MGEPYRPERAASKGKFHVWVEYRDGNSKPLPEEYMSYEEAYKAGEAFCRNNSKYYRVIIYGDDGWFKAKFVARK